MDANQQQNAGERFKVNGMKNGMDGLCYRFHPAILRGRLQRGKECKEAKITYGAYSLSSGLKFHRRAE